VLYWNRQKCLVLRFIPTFDNFYIDMAQASMYIQSFNMSVPMEAFLDLGIHRCVCISPQGLATDHIATAFVDKGLKWMVIKP